MILLRLAGFYFARRDFEKVRRLARELKDVDIEGRYERVLAPWRE